MPAENQEVLDDFLMDMDIEDITLDDIQLLEPEPAQDKQSSEKKSEEKTGNQIYNDLKLETVNIEEINLGENAASGPTLSSGNVQNVNIHVDNATVQGNIKGDITGDVQGNVYGNVTSGPINRETPPKNADLTRKFDEEIAIPGNIDSIGPEEISVHSFDTDFMKNMESDITLGELNRIEEIPEPSIPVEQPQMLEEFMDEPLAAKTIQPENKTKESSIFSSEDDIIFIDGKELDQIAYGGNDFEVATDEETPFRESGPEMSSIDQVLVIEEPPLVEEAFSTGEEKEEITLTAHELESGKKEEIPLAEEVISEEVPVSSLEVQSLDEGIISDSEPAANFSGEEIVIALDDNVSPNPIGEEPKPGEPEFNFDLSVIPDVEKVEEDEPIALSLDELNNIDISEEPSRRSVIEMADQISAPEEDDKIGISLDELNEIQKDISPIQSIEAKNRVINEQLDNLSGQTKDELKSMLSYLDQLLEDLPEEKIKEFAKSDYYDLYVKILDKLGL